MKGGAKDEKMKASDANNGLTERKTDGLADKYSSVAADGSKGGNEREAAMLFSVAEQHVDDDEDYDEALRAANEALQLFRTMKNSQGASDTLRLINLALLGKAEVYRWTERGDPKTNLVGQTQQRAKTQAEEELQNFQKNGDKRGAACMLLSLAEFYWRDRGLKSHEEAAQKAGEAEQIFREVGDRKLQASALQVLICINLKKYNVQEALKQCEQSLVIFRELGLKKDEASTLHMQAVCQLCDEKFQEAVATANEGLQIFRDLGIKKFIAFELFCIADWHLHQDKSKDALPLARESVELFQELDYSKGWQAGAADLVVQAQIGKGDKKQALKIAQDELERFQENGDKRSEVFARNSVMQAHLARENPADALLAAESGLEICRELQDKRWESHMLNNVAGVHLLNKAYDQASSAAQEAQQLAQQIGDKADEARVLQTLNDVHVSRKDYKMAHQAATSQREIYQATGDKNGEGMALLNMAAALGNEDKLDEAMSHAKEAQAVFQNLGSKRGEGSAWQVMVQLHLARQMNDLALQAAQKMQAMYDECDDKKLQAQGLSTLVGVHLAMADEDQALAIATQARVVAKKSESRILEAEMLIMMSNVHGRILSRQMQESPGADLGRAALDKAMKPSKEALLLAKKSGEKSLVAHATYTMGQMHLVQGRAQESLRAADDAARLFRIIGDTGGEAAAIMLSGDVHYACRELKLATDAANRASSLGQAVGDDSTVSRAQELLQLIQKAQWQSQPQQPQQLSDGAPVEQQSVAAPEKAGLDPVVVTKMVKETLDQSLGTDEAVDLDTPLMEAGMDSLSMVAFRNALQKESGIPMPASIMFDYPTMNGLIGHVVETSKQ